MQTTHEGLRGHMLTLLVSLLCVSSAQAEDRPRITSPSDDSVFRFGDHIPVAGEALEASAEVEVQVLDPQTGAWAHLSDVTASSTPFENENGEERYAWELTDFFMSCSDRLCTSGPWIGGGVQRTNSASLTVWGWGDGPEPEEGHYITVLEPCGYSGQQCCFNDNLRCEHGDQYCMQRCQGSVCGGVCQ